MSYQISPGLQIRPKIFESNVLKITPSLMTCELFYYPFKCLDQTMNFGRYEATNDYLESGGGRCQKSHNGSNIPGHNPRK